MSLDDLPPRRAILGTLAALATAGCVDGLLGAGGPGIEIVDGVPAPGETVTLRVTDENGPVADARVRIDYQVVGTTDGDGRITVTFPPKVDVAIDVSKGDFEVERKIEFSTTPTGGSDDLDIGIEPSDPGPGDTVTVTVTAAGEPIAGATVEVGGEEAGTTDADGQLEVTLPTGQDEVEIDADTSDRSGEITVTLE